MKWLGDGRASRRIRTTVHRKLQKALRDAGYNRTKASLIHSLDALGGAAAIRNRRVKQPS